MSDGFKLPKIDLSNMLKINLSNPPVNRPITINTGEEGRKRAQQDLLRIYEKENAYKEENIALKKQGNELLQEINSKLNGLDDIILLLIQSTNHQEEILELLNEVFSIGTSPDEETARSRYDKVEEKINKTAETYESVKTLAGLAKYIYAMTIG